MELYTTNINVLFASQPANLYNLLQSSNTTTSNEHLDNITKLHHGCITTKIPTIHIRRWETKTEANEVYSEKQPGIIHPRKIGLY